METKIKKIIKKLWLIIDCFVVLLLAMTVMEIAVFVIILPALVIASEAI